MDKAKDTYLTLAYESESIYKEKGSKFIAYASPINLETDFAVFLERIKKEHPKARHHCYAWRLGMDKNVYRANDDGEPSGTAGRPILGQIDSFGLTNVGIVVVRYFGGTLLGTSGLIQAYKESSADALKQGEVVEKTLQDIIEVRFGYDKMSDVMNAVKKLEITVLSQVFDANGLLTLSIRQSETEKKLLDMRALILKISVEEVLLRENMEQHDIPNTFWTEGVEILKLNL
jgi:uncharacterized YigZ family protein